MRLAKPDAKAVPRAASASRRTSSNEQHPANHIQTPRLAVWCGVAFAHSAITNQRNHQQACMPPLEGGTPFLSFAAFFLPQSGR